MIETDQESPQQSSSHRKDLDWAQIIVDWQRSGLSQTEFCKRHHYHFNSFSYQRGKYLKQNKKPSMAFSELTPTVERTNLSMSDIIKM